MLWVLAGIQFTHIVDFMVLMPLGPQIMRLFGVTPTQFGLLVSAYTFGAAASAFLAALYVDRFGRKRALLAIYSGFTVATALCAIAPGFWTLLAARVVSGIFGGIAGAMVHAIIGDLVPDSRRGAATGVIATGFPLAAVAGVPLGLLIGSHVGWHATFGALTLGAVLLWVAVWRWLPALDHHVATARATRSSRHHLQEVFASRSHRRALVLIGTLMFAGLSVIPFLSPYMVRNVGLQETDLPLIYLAGGAATLFTARWIGRLADRHGKVRVFRGVALLSMVPLFVSTHLPPLPVPIVMAASTVFMVLVSGRFIPAMALVNSAAEPRLRGAFLAVSSGIQSLCSGLASVAAGTVLGHDAAGRLTNYGIVGTGAVCATALCIYLAGRITPARGGT